MTFPSVDWLVAYLGAFSDESSLDALLPTMTLEHAQRQGGGHALLLRCAAADGYNVDQLARLAVATRGQLYTGTGTVFVRWRDRDAPFGYDLLETVTLDDADVAAVDTEYVARYTVLERMDPVELIQRLELRRVPLPLAGIGHEPSEVGLKEMVLCLVSPGLADRTLSYLWRTEVPMAGDYVQLEDDRRPSLLLRIRHPHGRLLDVLHRTPGIELFVPVSSRAAVEVGYRHPISLSSASTCLPGDEMYLFRGAVGRVERLAGPPRFIDGRHLVEPTGTRSLREVKQVRESELSPLQVKMHMRTSSVPREPRGTLVSWSQIGLLRRLVYMIPPSALGASRLVLLQEGVLVLTSSSLGTRSVAAAAGLGAGAIVPLGQRLGEVAPGVLVPDGYELWPRIRPQLTRQLLGLGNEEYAVFLSQDTSPIKILPEQLLSLDAALVGRLDLHEAELRVPELDALEAGQVTNERLSRFALWGFGGLSQPALPPKVRGPGQ